MHIARITESKRLIVSYDGEGNKSSRTVIDRHVNTHLLAHLRGGVFPRQEAPGNVAAVRANLATAEEREAGLTWTP